MTWTTDAKCKGLDTDLFFPPEREDFASRDEWQQAVNHKNKAAQAICKGCPVINDCLMENLNAPSGVFGGLNHGQRVRLAKRTNKYIPQDELRFQQTPMTEERINIILMHWRNGHSISDIETLTGINRGAIYRVVNDNKMAQRNENGDLPKGHSYRFQKSWAEPKYSTVRDLIKQGYNAKHIYRATGIHWKTVRRIKYSMEKAKEMELANDA